MATFEMEIPDEKIQKMHEGDRGGIAVLLEPILNQILQAEMTDHLGAESGERTDSRSGYRNGTYQRKLTTRVGTLELEVPRDRDGTFQTKLFERYQRSEKALVWAPHADGRSRGVDAPGQEDHDRALRPGVQ